MNLFSKYNLKKKDKQNDNIYRLLLPSFIAICICTICLSTTSWAWFTSTTSTSVSSIKAAYNLSYGINNYDKLTLIDGSVTYTIDNTGTCSITLSAENSTTNGYCIINYGNNDYYTNLINKGTTYGFTITASEGTVITLTPKWGSLPTNIASNYIIANNADNNSNPISTTSLDDFDLIDEDLSSTDDQENVDDVEVQEQQDTSNDGTTTSEEKTDEVPSELENQNIEEKQNEEPSKDSSESSSTEVTNSDDKTIKGEGDESHNSSSELTESVNSGNDSAES